MHYYSRGLGFILFRPCCAARPALILKKSNKNLTPQLEYDISDTHFECRKPRPTLSTFQEISFENDKNFQRLILHAITFFLWGD